MLKELKAYNAKPYYIIDDNGTIKNIERNFILSAQKDHNGYLQTKIQTENGRKSLLVHRLVAMTFLPKENCDSLTVNHIDGNKLNNNIKNLEWMTVLENTNNAKIFGYNGSDKYADMTEEIVDSIIYELSIGTSTKNIMNKLKCSLNTVNRIRQNKRWKSKTKNIKFIKTNLKKYTIEQIKEVCRLVILGYPNSYILETVLKNYKEHSSLQVIYSIKNHKSYLDIYNFVEKSLCESSETIEILKEK